MTNQQDQQEFQTLFQDHSQYLEEEQLQNITGGGFLDCLSCFKAPKTLELPPTIHFVDTGGMTPEVVRKNLARNKSVSVERGSDAAAQAVLSTGRTSAEYIHPDVLQRIGYR